MDTSKHNLQGKGPAAPSFPSSTSPAALPAPTGGSVLSAMTIGALVLGLLVGFGAGILWGKKRAPATDAPQSAGVTATSTGSAKKGSSTAVDVSKAVLPSDGAVKPAVTALGSGIAVADQAAGSVVKVGKVKLAAAAWVAVHDLVGGKPGNVLGAQLLPKGEYGDVSVQLLRVTKAGASYVVLVHDDNGNKKFENQLDAVEKDAAGNPMMGTFKAQ